MERENEMTDSEAAEVAEAAALIDPPSLPEGASEDGSSNATEADLSSEAPQGAEEEGEAAPEFWSADDKAAWNAVPAELRPVLKRYEQQRVELVNEKAREAAAIRAEAAEQVRRANAAVEAGIKAAPRGLEVRFRGVDSIGQRNTS
jgi:hypothetical protein